MRCSPRHGGEVIDSWPRGQAPRKASVPYRALWLPKEHLAAFKKRFLESTFKEKS